MRALIVANGVADAEFIEAVLADAPDLVIAADGGAEALRAADRTPDVIVGDLDSATAQTTEWARAGGATTVTHPTDKDFSDLELAIAEAHRHECTRVDILGALGGRIDHALVNIAVACSPRFASIEVWIRDPTVSMTPVHPGTTRRLAVDPGATVSLMAIGGPAQVSASGFRWELDNDVLQPTSSLGLSNVATVRDPSVEAISGIVLALCNE